MLRIDQDELLGAVKGHGSWHLYVAKPYQWAVAPEQLFGTVPKNWDGLFRRTTRGEIELSETASQVAVTATELAVAAKPERSGEAAISLSIAVDLSRRLLINGYFEQPLEEYVPIEWSGSFGDPVTLLDDEFVKELGYESIHVVPQRGRPKQVGLLDRIFKRNQPGDPQSDRATGNEG